MSYIMYIIYHIIYIIYYIICVCSLFRPARPLSREGAFQYPYASPEITRVVNHPSGTLEVPSLMKKSHGN